MLVASRAPSRSMVVLVCLVVLASCMPEGVPVDAASGLDAGPVDGGGRDVGASDASIADGGRRDAAMTCAVPGDCQDGVFCNGYEACAPGLAGADVRGCAAGTPPCAAACDETGLRCMQAVCDSVGRCTGDPSCSDALACNGVETCGADAVCHSGTGVRCAAGVPCIEPGICACTSDAACDDGAFCNGAERCASGRCTAGTPPCASACVEATHQCTCAATADCHPDTLYCNGIEYCNTGTSRCSVLSVVCPAGQSCLEGRHRCGICLTAADCDDGIASDGVETCNVATGACVRGRVDADGDGHASIATGGDDCDDGDANRFPGNPEVCDTVGHDEDCDARTFGTTDADGDHYISTVCDNTDAIGVRRGGDDCDDSNGNVHLNQPEACNAIDDDCDGAIDEGVTVSLFRDRDDDGDGDPGCGEQQCAGTAGWVTQSGDCDDTRAAIRNGATVCDPAGRGVRTCGDGTWMAAPCPAGTSCRPQPNGTGLCI